jgi:hypothetical protein
MRGVQLLLLFILTANGFLPGGSGTTVKHNTNNTAHKTTQTIKDTLHTMNTMQIQFQLQLYKLILIKNKHTICNIGPTVKVSLCFGSETRVLRKSEGIDALTMRYWK